MAHGALISQEPVSIQVIQVIQADEARIIGFSLETHLVGRFLYPESAKSRDESQNLLIPEGMNGGCVRRTKKSS